MKKYPVENLRNIALISHGGAGKTSLAEAVLFDTGVIDRLGKVDEGTATMDFDPEEIRRKVSISTGVASCEWQEHRITLLDAPGYFDFVGEVKAALRVADAALVLVDAVAGVEVGTELVWGFADERNLPRFLVVNKMDRENANFDKAVASARKSFGAKAIPIQLPVGAEASFKGVVDLIQLKAITYPDGNGTKPQEGSIPADLSGKAQELRASLMEAAAENDDDLLTKYLEGEELTEEEIRLGLRKGVLAGKVVPILAAAGTRNIGLQPLLTAVTALLPSPADLGAVKGVNPKNNSEVTRKPEVKEPFSALVFKTMADPFVGRLNLFRVYSGTLKSDSHVYNSSKGRSERIGQLFLPRGKQQEAVEGVSVGDIAAVAKLQETGTGDTLCDESQPAIYEGAKFPAPVYSVAVQPKSKGDEEKISSGLARLTEEDLTFKVEKNASTGQLLISGMGELHLDVITEKLKRKFGVEVTVDTPKVPYKETIRGSVKVEGKHKKQTGGRGQYGHVWLELEPYPDGEFEFVDKIFGGVVPQQYRPAAEKGVREAMQEGILAGYPVTGVRVSLVDGSYHTVDSSEMAFKIAGSLAFKKGALEAKPVILEPIVSVEVLVPDDYMGDVIGDLNKKRGRILGMEPHGSNQMVRALVPQTEMLKYAIDLRSITQGRGTFSMQFDHYEEVPANIAQQIIEEYKKEKGAEK
ncbi:MAG: elongation factor G [Firmicutes bacterium]|nr:elongation factor G [Bacillota bacterium]MCL5038648.1 elongation factor G [Bacillota bacterium]